MQTTDTIVIGAGVIGLTCAWRLASSGVDVSLVDPHPGRGASWAAAGMLAPVTELHYGEERLLQLNLAALQRWPDHVAALADAGVDVGHRSCGSVLVARDADDAGELRRLLEVQSGLGMEVTWLRSRELRALEPGLSPSVRGGIRVEGDHQVDNRALVSGLLALCRAHQRISVHMAAAVRIDGADRGAARVELDDGTALSAPHVVLAAGAAAGQVVGLPAPLPIRPVKGQLLHLRADGPLASRNVRGEDCYIVSRADGRLVVGATMEERGFDGRPTAGAVQTLLEAAWELLPGIAEATFVEVAVGFRPATPDNAPIMGPHPEVPGLILATGHHRNGVLQSALTAEAVLGWVRGEATPADVAGLDLRRFVEVDA